MKRFIERLLSAWDAFFFGPISLLPVGVFRFVFGLNLLVMYGIRMVDWRFFFTDEGIVSAEKAMQIVPEFYQPIVTWFPTTPTMAFGMHAALLIAIVGLTVGVLGRWMAAATLFLHLAFMQRNFSIVYGADLVSSFFLFGLVFAENDRNFSLRAWLKRGESKPIRAWSSVLSTVGVRLIQLQLCIIYGYTGLEKLKGQSWWDGTAVWAVLGNQQIMMFDSSWLKAFPLAIAAMTFSTLVFEIYFPVLAWLKATKRWTLAFGVALHGGIAVTVGLFFFSMAMISTYLVFLDPAWLRDRLGKWVPSRWLGPK